MSGFPDTARQVPGSNGVFAVILVLRDHYVMSEASTVSSGDVTTASGGVGAGAWGGVGGAVRGASHSVPNIPKQCAACHIFLFSLDGSNQSHLRR